MKINVSDLMDVVFSGNSMSLNYNEFPLRTSQFERANRFFILEYWPKLLEYKSELQKLNNILQIKLKWFSNVMLFASRKNDI